MTRELPEDAIYWINATDPVSVCGLDIEAFKGRLPRRVEGAHLVYHGSRLVAVSERQGRSLLFEVPPDHEHLQAYLAPLRHMLHRSFQALRSIRVETINEIDAARSPFLGALKTAFDVSVDYKHVMLYRRLQ